MSEKNKKTSILNIFDSIYAKIGLSIYSVIIAAVVSYFTSKIFYEMLWPNERFTVCAFMTVSIMLSFGIMIFRINALKALLLFHFVLITTPLSLILPYEFRLYPAIILIVCLLSDYIVGIVSAIGICSYGFVTMASEPEFFFTIITLITGVCSLIIAKAYKNNLQKATAILIVILINCGLHLIFATYCNETYLEYATAEFIFKCMAGQIIAIVIYLCFELVYNKFCLKKSFKSVFVKMRSDDYKPKSFLKTKSEKLYKHSKEVAVLSEKAASLVEADKDICYVGGLFHDIGKMFGNDYIKEGVKFAYKYDFPVEIINIIGCHTGKENLPQSKEEGIVLLADTVSSAVSYMKSKDKDITLDKIIDNSIMNKISKGVLNESKLTITDICMIKKIFLKEMESKDVN